MVQGMTFMSWGGTAARSLGLGLALAVAGCGGGSGGSASCSEVFDPCGGDVIGEWTLVGACTGAISNPLEASCPTAEFTADLTASGTAVLRTDGTYSTDIAIGGQVFSEIPASCVEPQTCTDLSDPTENRSCEGTDQCHCTTELDDSTDSGSGTYLTSGTTLTLLGTSGASEYCVAGDTMRVQIDALDAVLVFTR